MTGADKSRSNFPDRPDGTPAPAPPAAPLPVFGDIPVSSPERPHNSDGILEKLAGVRVMTDEPMPPGCISNSVRRKMWWVVGPALQA